MSDHARPARGEALAFIDVEASGLNARSWPVEAGWALAAGGARSLLIRPDAAWSLAAWDPRAEALHGITLDELRRDGAAPEDVCTTMNAALRGCAVYSDAPDWDGFWLHRLYATAGLKQEFSVLDFAALMRDLAPGDPDALAVRADAFAPRRHRAGADARHLQAVWRLARAAGGD